MVEVVEKFSFGIYLVLLLIGLWAMIGKRNLVKKVIGMTIFQAAIILFFVSIGAKDEATIPILRNYYGPDATPINPADYANPLVHVLMLTAIVVGVSTLGVALSLIQKVHGKYGTVEENEILEKST